MEKLKAKLKEKIVDLEKYSSLQTNDYQRGFGDGKTKGYREVLRWLNEKPIATKEYEKEIMPIKYVAELEPDVWIAPWQGDPGRTLSIINAKVFNNRSTAWRAIERARKMRPFESADVRPISTKE